ncbi:MAG: hypothetical protein KDK30_03845 [Leptospiraceae bacterium]|nr:hypothetical protein [Leptospiraceae bacterium]
MPRFIATHRSTLLALPALLSLALFTVPVQPCGPQFPQAIFTYNVHPDMPLTAFAAGQPGIIEPEFARSYLVVAYRALTKQPLNALEQKAAVRLWSARLNHGSDDTSWLEDASLSENESNDTDCPDGQLQCWLAARRTVSDVPDIKLDDLRVYRRISDQYYGQFRNCLPDAFRYARTTLRQRSERLGADDRAVRAWVLAQDRVFQNCSAAESIPPETGARDVLLQADRQYQIASAYFYALRFQEAERHFRQIAADANSPHRLLARYLVARTLIRRASLQTEPGQPERKALYAAAERELDGILACEACRDWHASARELLHLVRYRAFPEKLLADLPALLGQPSRDFGRYLDEYTRALDRVLVSYERGEQSLEQIVQNRDMTDWILHFQSVALLPDPDPALAHSLERFRQTDSVAWLLAALSKVDANHPATGELLRAAEQMRPDHPGYISIFYHRMRLKLAAGQYETVRTELDNLLKERRTRFAPATLNRFLTLRMRVAVDMNDFARHATRRPATITSNTYEQIPFDWEQEGPRTDPLFDLDAVMYINQRFALSDWMELADNDRIPERLRHEILAAGFVRAFLIGNDTLAQAFAEPLSKNRAALKDDLELYLKSDANRAQLMGLLVILRNPGLRPYVNSGLPRDVAINEIHNYRDNWWCAVRRPNEQTTNSNPANPKPTGLNIDKEVYELNNRYSLHRMAWWDQQYALLLFNRTPFNNLPFLSAEQRSQASQQWNRMQSMETAPNLLIARLLHIADRHRADDLLPEALHLAVRATRYGCTDDHTTQYSQRAFQYLHRHFPDSAWTRKTPYYY